MSATASSACQPNSNDQSSCAAAISMSGMSCGQLRTRFRRDRGSADRSSRHAVITLTVSGVARSTTPVRSVFSDETRKRTKSSTCSTRIGCAETLVRSSVATVRHTIQSSWRPTGGAIRTTRLGPQLVDTSSSAGRYSSGRPAAWDTNSSRAPARAAASVTCATPSMSTLPGAVVSTGARWIIASASSASSRRTGLRSDAQTNSTLRSRQGCGLLSNAADRVPGRDQLPCDQPPECAGGVGNQDLHLGSPPPTST